ncbi:aspartyl aminopeptidase [Desulfitispora alkaliphila]|uniref:aminopeptidase n=1 Tax=Desulfitispora alkaliphila TaxID=622674 RepID=UPI003D202D60
MSEKSKLRYEPKTAWEIQKDKEEQVYAFAEDYKYFLSEAKTERQTVSKIVELAENNGFRHANQIEVFEPGTRIYWVHQNKSVILAVLGVDPLESGLNIIGSHVDAPRLDLKPNPLYQEKGVGLLKTHYYGGIKKYQWVGMPLALHGVVFTEDGRKLEISLGERHDDPVFTITDLLPHLAKEQMEKTLAKGIAGEGLNVLVGSKPLLEGKFKEKIVEGILAELNRHYGMVEEDFISAELELVPAGAARDVGFDRSMVGGYGQDDRVCVYTSLEAILQTERPKKTAVALFADKEEIGSTGSTGMQSEYFPYFLAQLVASIQEKEITDLIVRRSLINSMALSADVSVADDPNYQGVLDKKNGALLGNGVVLTKYTGVGGKSGASDANAEYMNLVRRMLKEKGIAWQVAELGKVDQGGGGTIARFLGEYGMEIVDCGPALLGMHSPFEVASKADIYATYLTYKAFYELNY